VKAPAFDLVEPMDFDDAVGVLAADDEARVLAGGQSLVPMLNFRLLHPTTLVGLRKLPTLRGLERRGGEVVVGAMVTQRETLESSVVAEACPLVTRALAHIGHPQIRSRGTIGGTLAHADPAAELPAVLLALDGAVIVRGPGQPRRIPAEEFYVGYYSTSLEPGEILTQACFPVAGARTGAACVELARRPGDFAILGVACQLTLDPDGSIADARIALFAVGELPVRARSVERELRGARPGRAAWVSASEMATDGWAPVEADNEQDRYRARVASVIVHRALDEAARRAGGMR
jgi:aerobic carbon-monoxide dehydrogenase medium subunit